MPPEELGEDEVDDEDLAIGAGPGVPVEERWQHSRLRGAEGSTRPSCHAKAALQNCSLQPKTHRNPKSKRHALDPACRFA